MSLLNDLTSLVDLTGLSSLPGHLNVKASSIPFLTLASDVNVLFQVADGSFVVTANGTTLWEDGVVHPACSEGGCHLQFSKDGNLVTFDGNTAMWSSETAGAGAKLVFRHEKPYVTIYGSNGTSIWNTGTATASNGNPKKPPKVSPS